MSSILLELTFRGINVDFFTFSNGYITLMVRGRDNFVSVDPRSSEQQMIVPVNDMKIE